MVIVLGCGVTLGVQGAPLEVGKPFDVTPGLEKGRQQWPVVAYGKGVYLVVWQEGSGYAGTRHADIMGARVSKDGKVLDKKGILICGAKHHQLYPAVCFDGENFVVAWQDFRSGKDWDVYATRVSPEGRVLDADGVKVAAVEGNQVYPAVASGGGKTVILWSDIRPRPKVDDLWQPEGYALYGTLLREGRPVVEGGKVIRDSFDPKKKRQAISILPQVVWDGEAFDVLIRSYPASWDYGATGFLRLLPDLSRDTTSTISKERLFFNLWCSIAADVEGKRVLVWSLGKRGHGEHELAYLSTFFRVGGGSHIYRVYKFQERGEPANEILRTLVYDGKNFVAVTEYFANYQGAWRLRHGALDVDLYYCRFSAADGSPLDLPYKEPLKDPRTRRLLKYQGPQGFFRGEKFVKMEGKLGGNLVVTAEKNVPERQPALASQGGGKSLLVYSRHGGAYRWKIYAVMLSE